MANFTKSISVSINLLQAASRWNAYNWNAFNWGYGTTPLNYQVQHSVNESLISTTVVSHIWLANVSLNETLILTDGQSKEVQRTFGDSLNVSSDPSTENLQDAAGYYYVFSSNATNAEDRDITSYTSGTNQSSIYTSAAVSSTSWS